MKITLDMNPSYEEEEIVIKGKKMTEQIEELIGFLSQKEKKEQSKIVGTKDQKLILLNGEDLIRVYAASGKVYGETKEETYQLKSRVYQIEERMPAEDFVRISKSEIINLRAVKYFDISFTGTIEILFENGKKTYVSRRYVKLLKERLGVQK